MITSKLFNVLGLAVSTQAVSDTWRHFFLLNSSCYHRMMVVTLITLKSSEPTIKRLNSSVQYKLTNDSQVKFIIEEHD